MQLPELPQKLTASTETRTALWRAQTNSKIIGLKQHDTLQQAEPLPLCPAQCNVETTNWRNETTIRSECRVKYIILCTYKHHKMFKSWSTILNQAQTCQSLICVCVNAPKLYLVGQMVHCTLQNSGYKLICE